MTYATRVALEAKAFACDPDAIRELMDELDAAITSEELQVEVIRNLVEAHPEMSEAVRTLLAGGSGGVTERES